MGEEVIKDDALEYHREQITYHLTLIEHRVIKHVNSDE